MTITIILLIALALVFDFLNGFHDSANAIATVVSTRVLSPTQAVIWAAAFEFMAYFFFGSHVANTIGKGIVNIAVIDKVVIFGALTGACAWNLITWYYGLPSSSSHALIGGLMGAAIVKAGVGSLLAPGIIKVVSFIVISPIIGFFLGRFMALFVYWLCRRSTPAKVDKFFRGGQLLSSALFSLGHGGNDAQKTMGIIASLLFSAGLLGKEFYVPSWVAIICYAAISIGIMSGGWRIVKTIGQKMARLKPVDGFCAETTAAASLYIASAFGIPVSTTHTISGSIMGVGSIKRLSAVRWGVVQNMVWAWIITIPAAALISAGAYYLGTFFLK
jgi:PiT family inorganic phosphate transporter